MAFLIDTGILLRILDSNDPLHESVTDAVESLVRQKQELYTSLQNISELWNVATRPPVNNGLGLSPSVVVGMIESTIEPTCQILFEHHDQYRQLKRLGQKYRFIGKQVHDARLVAMMLTWNVMSILTLNERDFRRYGPERIEVATPDSVSRN